MSNPMIAWGTPEDLTTWTKAAGDGTVAITGSVPNASPFGGDGYSANDLDSSAVGEFYTEYTATYSGWHIAMMCIRMPTTSGYTSFRFGNTTLASYGRADYTWASSVASQTTAGTGVFEPLPFGGYTGGWQAQRIAQYANAGNTMRLTLYPAGMTAGSQFACYAHVGNIVFLDVVDNAIAYEEPRDGSAWAQSGSGVEDAWIQGTDYRLRLDVPWIPQVDRDVPEHVTGWGNPLERVGVNCGVQAMLRAGRNKETLTYYHDRDITLIAAGNSGGTDGYLVSPLNGAPTLQSNGDRSLTLELRSTDPYRGLESLDPPT